jgi:hypothetical protein
MCFESKCAASMGPGSPLKPRVVVYPPSMNAKTALVRLLGIREHIPAGTEIWTLD